MVGKTNLDQFASGLVGTRSPYGVAPNSFDDRFIPGGSSSGSAAAVGAGLVTFALGTDTAGSGRVPAGYNGCVGVKPTLGKISSVGESHSREQGGSRRGVGRGAARVRDRESRVDSSAEKDFDQRTVNQDRLGKGQGKIRPLSHDQCRTAQWWDGIHA